MKKSKRKKWKIILIVIFCLLLAMSIAVMLWLPSFIMTGNRQTLEEAFKWQSEHYDTSFYGSLEKEEYTVSGEDGYQLHAECLKNPVPTTKYIILSHGYTDNRMGSLKYVPMYLELGFNCIIYDLRGHGANEPYITTYGVLEGADLNMLVKDTRDRFPDITVLGLHGESLGAATTITSLKYAPSVDFSVSDCGFSDIENVLKEGYKNAHVPVFLVDLADIGARIRYHYSIRAMRPVDSLDENEVPILFIHGEDDTLILPENSKSMAERTKGYSEYRIIPGAGHAESVLTDPALYEEYVRSFLESKGFYSEPPHFVMLSDRKYKTGSDFSLTDLVYAEDSDGNDISDRIGIISDGGYDPGRAGTYEVTYIVTDEKGTAAKETITVSVGDYEANDYGFSIDSDVLSFLIDHDYFAYEPLSEDKAGDIKALTDLTSPASFGAAYDDGACSCFLYKVTKDRLIFFTNKHCPVDSAETLCLYDHNDNVTLIPSSDIIYEKYYPEFSAVANGYLQYDQQMFAVPVSYFVIDELLEFKEVHTDLSAFENLKAGDMFLMNTQSWRRCQKDIVLENKVLYTDCYERTAYHYDADGSVPALSHMVVGELKNAVGSCSGSPCFDKYGNMLGFIWGTTYADGPELIYLDQFVPLPYFLEFAGSVNF